MAGYGAIGIVWRLWGLNQGEWNGYMICHRAGYTTLCFNINRSIAVTLFPRPASQRAFAEDEAGRGTR